MRRSKGQPQDTTKRVIPQSYSRTTEEVAEDEIRKAKEKGLEEPDFDFRKLYRSGDIIYYVWINYLTGVKELLKLTVRTIYARSLIAWEEKGNAHMISYPTREWIFMDRREAQKAYKDVEVEAMYGG